MQRYGYLSMFLYYYSLTLYQFRRFYYLCSAMKKILKVDNPNVYAEYVGAPVLHPQLALISYDEVSPFRSSLNSYGVYGLFIQQQFPKYLSYGTKSVLVGDSSILSVAPGQIGGAEDNGTPLYINGWVLLWSPELMKGTPLEGKIDSYHFFSYFYTDWLRMTPAEWEQLSSLLSTMRKELLESPDSPVLRSILCGYLSLILEYCQRIYLRQLSQEESDESDILKRFHRLLVDYFSKGVQHEKGLPTVAWCAGELAYSAGYFGGMIHQATGGTAIGYIHSFVIDQAKTFLMKGLSVGEVADLLGFEYPHHFQPPVQEGDRDDTDGILKISKSVFSRNLLQSHKSAQPKTPLTGVSSTFYSHAIIICCAVIVQKWIKSCACH